MASKAVIREFQPSDESQVVELVLGIQQEEFGIEISLDDQPDLLEVPGFYQKGAGNFWVAALEDDVVGTVALIDIGDKQVALRKMFVRKDCRGKELGIAHALLANLIQWSKSKGVHEILLGTTSKYHAAHRFYAKNGFREIEKSELPESFPVMEVDSKFFRFVV